MNDDLKDILLDGETVLWRGAPDYSHAKSKPRTKAQLQRERVIWSLIAFVVTAALFSLGYFFSLTGFIGTFLSTLVAFFGVGTLIGVSRLFAIDIKVYDRWDQFLVTDRRVAAVCRRDENISSISAGRGTLVELRKNGDRHDILVGFPNDDDESLIIIAAIEGGPAVHKLVLQTLISARDISK